MYLIYIIMLLENLMGFRLKVDRWMRHFRLNLLLDDNVKTQNYKK